MYIVCLVSPNPGHLDFGGFGFLKLAQELRDRGHALHWFAPSLHCERLRAEGFSVTDDDSVALLRLMPLLSPEKIEQDVEGYRARIAALRLWHSLISARRPDLILLDRLLTFGQLIAEELNVPTAVVGTNGAYWKRVGAQVLASNRAVPEYREVGDTIKRDLNWSSGSLDSFWACSQQVNVSFLGRNFYANAPVQCGRGMHVNHFNPPDPVLDRRAHGVSFGNSGDEALMVKVTAYLRALSSPGTTLEIITGNRKRAFQLLSADNRRDEHVHGWVNFSEFLPRLKTLTFFGGIGTIWHCINHQVPMLVVPGGLGDQQFNAQRVSELGLGERLFEAQINHHNVETAWNRLRNEKSYLREISRFKDMDNYTDTLTTAVNELERLA